MNDDLLLDGYEGEQKSDSRISRRRFIKGIGSGIILYFTVGDLSLFGQEGRGRGRSLPEDFNAFLRIGEDGRVTCYTGKVEMGQGVVTSLAQMLADEIDVSPDSVDMVMGDTDLCPWDMGTFGSMSTRIFGQALRFAGAEARQVLLKLGAQHLRVQANNLSIENGVVFIKTDRKKRVTYAQLAGGRKIERHATGNVSIKTSPEFKVMGKQETRRDARQKVTGEALYTGDIRLPGMLYGKILRPPSHDSKMVSADLAEAKKIPGMQVFQQNDFIGVVHQYPDVAEAAIMKIKAKFDTPQSPLNPDTIFDHLLKVAPEGKIETGEGDLKKGEQGAATVFDETYLDGYKAHAPIEPHTALVSVEQRGARVWASTQTPFSAKEEVAKELGILSDKVHVLPVFVGGGFGGKSRNQQIVEAARLSKLCGKPVQVGWSREEEFFYDAFRPAAIVKIRSGIGTKGEITFWDYHVYFAGSRGAQQFYNIPNHATVIHNSSWMSEEGSHPFATGPWRAPGNSTNTFARESQIDIMAAKEKADPLDFRLRHLMDERMQKLLMAAAKKFGWKPAAAPSGRGFGIACGLDAGSAVATFLEAAVDKKTGEVAVKRVVCAQDMGLSVNPEGAAIQMEGCITMGLGYALKEDVQFNGGAVLTGNFDTYDIPRFSWLPKIETVIIDDTNSPPQGGGEPAIITMGAAIANAIYDAAGIRVFRLPMTPDRVLEALKNK